MEKTNKPSIEDVVAHNIGVLVDKVGAVSYSTGGQGSLNAIVSRQTGEILFADSTITLRDGLGTNPTIRLSYPPAGRRGEVRYSLPVGEEELDSDVREILDRTFEEYNHPSH